eukprot:2660896-Amphidinium_carterae.1
MASDCSNFTLCISSTCSRRPLVFAFISLTACSARPIPELSPLLASLMMTSMPSLGSSSPTLGFSARMGCSPSLRKMTFVPGSTASLLARCRDVPSLS